ncbi:MAG: hypothetical protein QOF14_3480 [Hyphomicrobiales bacterium]|jgi:hypothetical protein|nr:hypothetical protein [Hyphomicrobiales bacterium]
MRAAPFLAGLIGLSTSIVVTSVARPALSQSHDSLSVEAGMAHEETYKGQKIRIRTKQAADGTWQASAELPDQVDQSITAPGAFSSEQEARSAAMSAAAEHVDRSRARIGKP